MRISDWSSDVCSSDLLCACPPERTVDAAQKESQPRAPVQNAYPGLGGRHIARAAPRARHLGRPLESAPIRRRPGAGSRLRQLGAKSRSGAENGWPDRKSTRLNSRSLMRISYAVFCLNKKTTVRRFQHEITNTTYTLTYIHITH